MTTKKEIEKNALEDKLMARKNKYQELNKALEEATKIDDGIEEIGRTIGNLQKAIKDLQENIGQMDEEVNRYIWPNGLSDVIDILSLSEDEIFRAHEKFNREKSEIEAELSVTEMECEKLEEKFKECL